MFQPVLADLKLLEFAVKTFVLFLIAHSLSACDTPTKTTTPVSKTAVTSKIVPEPKSNTRNSSSTPAIAQTPEKLTETAEREDAPTRVLDAADAQEPVVEEPSTAEPRRKKSNALDLMFGGALETLDAKALQSAITGDWVNNESGLVLKISTHGKAVTIHKPVDGKPKTFKGECVADANRLVTCRAGTEKIVMKFVGDGENAQLWHTVRNDLAFERKPKR